MIEHARGQPRETVGAVDKTVTQGAAGGCQATQVTHVTRAFETDDALG